MPNGECGGPKRGASVFWTDSIEEEDISFDSSLPPFLPSIPRRKYHRKKMEAQGVDAHLVKPDQTVPCIGGKFRVD